MWVGGGGGGAAEGFGHDFGFAEEEAFFFLEGGPSAGNVCIERIGGGGMREDGLLFACVYIYFIYIKGREGRGEGNSHRLSANCARTSLRYVLRMLSTAKT